MIDSEATTWKLSDLGRQKLNSDDVLEPEIELLLRVVRMMERPTTQRNIVNIANRLIEIFGGVEKAIEAIIDGEVALEWTSVV